MLQSRTLLKPTLNHALDTGWTTWHHQIPGRTSDHLGVASQVQSKEFTRNV